MLSTIWNNNEVLFIATTIFFVINIFLLFAQYYLIAQVYKNSLQKINNEPIEVEEVDQNTKTANFIIASVIVAVSIGILAVSFVYPKATQEEIMQKYINFSKTKKLERIPDQQ